MDAVSKCKKKLSFPIGVKDLDNFEMEELDWLWWEYGAVEDYLEQMTFEIEEMD